MSRRHREYLNALIYPVLATPVALAAHPLLPHGSVSLVYLTAVLAVAVRSSARPAMMCAMLSFVAYELFFIEPYLALRAMSLEDLLTVSFFLLMAAVTGQLSEQVREQLLALKARQAIDQVQLELSQRLTTVADGPGIIDAVARTLCKMMPATCIVLAVEGGQLQPRVNLTDAENEIAQRAFRKREVLLDDGRRLLAVPLHEAEDQIAVLALRLDPVRRGKLAPDDQVTVATAVAQQAALALSRTRLSEALAREQQAHQRKLNAQRQWVGVKGLVEAAAQRIRDQFREHQLDTAIGGLPPFYGHPTLLEQALVSALENAVQMAPAGSTVALDACHRDGEILVDIRNAGQPIDASGGRSLITCQELIAALGGSVQMFNPLSGTGTVVRIRLPVGTLNEPADVRC